MGLPTYTWVAVLDIRFPLVTKRVNMAVQERVEFGHIVRGNERVVRYRLINKSGARRLSRVCAPWGR
jgi:hypothetical protein